MLERYFECLAADLHEVHALGAGVHLLEDAETARGADDLSEGVRDGDCHALGSRDDDVVVGRPVDGNVEETCLFSRQGFRGG